MKLLISVNRKNGHENAKENIELAIELFKTHSEFIVGIDLSGDPSSGGAFLDLLNSARESGLKIAAHCAEVNIISMRIMKNLYYCYFNTIEH